MDNSRKRWSSLIEQLKKKGVLLIVILIISGSYTRLISLMQFEHYDRKRKAALQLSFQFHVKSEMNELEYRL